MKNRLLKRGLIYLKSLRPRGRVSVADLNHKALQWYDKELKKLTHYPSDEEQQSLLKEAMRRCQGEVNKNLDANYNSVQKYASYQKDINTKGMELVSIGTGVYNPGYLITSTVGDIVSGRVGKATRRAIDRKVKSKNHVFEETGQDLGSFIGALGGAFLYDGSSALKDYSNTNGADELFLSGKRPIFNFAKNMELNLLKLDLLELHQYL